MEDIEKLFEGLDDPQRKYLCQRLMNHFFADSLGQVELFNTEGEPIGHFIPPRVYQKYNAALHKAGLYEAQQTPLAELRRNWNSINNLMRKTSSP